MKKSTPGKMLSEVIRALAKKPATIMYPAEKLDMPENYRGKLSVDVSKCVGCKLCMRDCPAGAINIKKVADKKFEIEINFSRCIYCGQCAESCNKKVIVLTKNVELAQLDVDKLTEVFSPQIEQESSQNEQPKSNQTATVKPAE